MYKVFRITIGIYCWCCLLLMEFDFLMENPDESEPRSHDIVTRTVSLLELNLTKCYKEVVQTCTHYCLASL